MRRRLWGPALVLFGSLGAIGRAGHGAPDRGSENVETVGQAALPNRLIDASSPYLRQHADNPVDWHEWGPEAISLAQREQKPIFLSIGYAACHWCHVMAHESFEDPETAAVMNRLFVNIKVDREERPDLDEVYMQATMMLNQGQGGWPMSVWLTPDLKPFFAGTYYPPTSRYGRPGFSELCKRIGGAWREHHDEVVAQADRLTNAVRESLHTRAGETTSLSLTAVENAAESIAGMFDTVSGGMSGGGTNKFPPSMAMDLLLRSAHRRSPDSARRRQFVQLTELTLDHMAAGGIYDQLGGGIHRYATDVEWHVPHFEKMLYDQALVSRIYLDGYQLTGKPLYARVAREIFDYVLRDLRSPEGGFFSTRDADSEGVEGRYYVWTRDEVMAALGEEDGELFCARYDISKSGNWNDPHDPGAAKSIPRALRDHACCAKLYALTERAVEERLDVARRKLLALRDKRVPPGLDDKVLCEWNGLMIASLARGGCVLNEPKYIHAAAEAAEFILKQHLVKGRLHRSSRHGKAAGPAFLSDYAAMIAGMIELYEATFDRRWLDAATKLNRAVIQHYWDDETGGFYFTADDHETLIARSKEVRDNAVPSGNSVMLMNLLRLSVLLGDEKLRTRADRQMAVFASEIERGPWAAECFLGGVDFAHGKPIEIAIIGDPTKPETQALLQQVHSTYLPNRVLVLHNPARPNANATGPLLANRQMIDGKPTAYVCRDSACQQPVTTPDELAAQLGKSR